jgi:hypothetical protein
LSTTDLASTDMVSNVDLCSERPATNCLSLSTANIDWLISILEVDYVPCEI